MTLALRLAALLLALASTFVLAPAFSPAARTVTAQPAQPTIPPPPTSCEAWTVTGITDGDTITAEFRGDPYTIRYIGVDTPERGRIFWREARDLNRSLVGNQEICAERDVRDRDDFNRLLRYVWRKSDGLFINLELVRRGVAWAATYPPDVKHADLFVWYQREAATLGRGFWGLPHLFLPAVGVRGCVNINTASLDELDMLDGIGLTLAQRIIDGRPYRSLDDLVRVPGIGPGTIDKIRVQGLACV